MRVRSPKYLLVLMSLASIMTSFGVFGFDWFIDWINLSKGWGIFWAFALLGLTVVVWIGLAIDLMVICVQNFLDRKKAHG